MRRSIVALLFVIAGCGMGPQSENAPRAFPPTALEPPPVYALLGYREDIGLSSEQVTALDSVAEAVRRENAPLVREIRERNPARAEQRGIIVVDSVSQPALDSLRENNREAVEAVGEILTAEQRTTACRLFGQSQRDRMARRGTAQQNARMRQNRAVQPDSAWTGGTGGWSWCAPASPDAQAVIPQTTPHVETPPDTISPG
jgi:hypothetical protein